METGSAASRRDRQEGFTLIELMVVLLIIAILIAILMPTFFGARTRAMDRAAQSNLRNALTAAKSLYTDTQDYTSVTETALAPEEPSLSFVPAATVPTTRTMVSVNPVSATYIVMAGLSKSGTCFYISDDTTVGTRFAKDPAPAACNAGTAPAQGSAAWTAQW